MRSQANGTPPSSDPGTLIVFEGIDGSGKSTIAKAVAAKVAETIGVVFDFAFPTKTTAPGKLIRQVFADPMLCRLETMLYLFVADALDAQGDVRAALRAGHVVVCDRYTPISAFVYNVNEHHSDTAVGEIVQLEQFVTPDLAFIVDVPTAVSEARIAARSGKTGEARNEIYEKSLEEKRQRYLRFGKLPEFLVLDGTLPVERNVAEAAERILAIHKTKGPAIS